MISMYVCRVYMSTSCGFPGLWLPPSVHLFSCPCMLRYELALSSYECLNGVCQAAKWGNSTEGAREVFVQRRYSKRIQNLLFKPPNNLVSHRLPLFSSASVYFVIQLFLKMLVDLIHAYSVRVDCTCASATMTKYNDYKGRPRKKCQWRARKKVR